jgi:hypothetical protein
MADEKEQQSIMPNWQEKKRFSMGENEQIIRTNIPKDHNWNFKLTVI